MVWRLATMYSIGGGAPVGLLVYLVFGFSLFVVGLVAEDVDGEV